MARLAERMAREAETLPYRWGYIQGVLLIPSSLLILLGTASDLLKPQHEPWYRTTIGFLMGFAGLPLAFGILRKRRFALALVYLMLGLSTLLVLIRIAVAIGQWKYPSDQASAVFEFELLLIWLLSLVYYRRRRIQFH